MQCDYFGARDTPECPEVGLVCGFRVFVLVANVLALHLTYFLCVAVAGRRVHSDWYVGVHWQQFPGRSTGQHPSGQWPISDGSHRHSVSAGTWPMGWETMRQILGPFLILEVRSVITSWTFQKLNLSIATKAKSFEAAVLKSVGGVAGVFSNSVLLSSLGDKNSPLAH